MENLKNLLKELLKTGRDDILLLNILYYLCKSYKVTNSLKTLSVDDLELIYDNLEINNEIITSDNINEYKEYLENNCSMGTINKITSGESILLLNYYSIYNDLVNCKILLKNIDNKLVF